MEKDFEAYKRICGAIRAENPYLVETAAKVDETFTLSGTKALTSDEFAAVCCLVAERSKANSDATLEMNSLYADVLFDLVCEEGWLSVGKDGSLSVGKLSGDKLRDELDERAEDWRQKLMRGED